MSSSLSPHALGYLSSIILLITLGSQIHKQWKRGSSRGVSPWLFIGQFAASCGFIAYSALIDSQVFIVTNSCIAVAALVGLAIVLYHRVKMRHSNVRDVLARSDRLGVPSSGRPEPIASERPERPGRSGAPLEVHHGPPLHRT
ncbi:MAG: SemiSWEET family transporter [Polyangia bacterium]